MELKPSSFSLWPIFCDSVVIHFGAHQQSSRSRYITAGTSSMRMIVASMTRAAIMPKAMYFIITISEKAKAPATTIMISAAAVMMPPVVAVPNRIALAVEAPWARASTILDTRNTS